ncbi:CLUMA_CG002908, isoform A [Clunio marinus]|uniref:CLUMA_CG002908, isoform A n=1 Tax=Clunio marinus TaxID=568069 RepID=A0A1J1HMI3_9DIPT|nr:CLUMA_CG002908, isoform A [Clunio marinus]
MTENFPSPFACLHLQNKTVFIKKGSFFLQGHEHYNVQLKNELLRLQQKDLTTRNAINCLRLEVSNYSILIGIWKTLDRLKSNPTPNSVDIRKKNYQAFNSQ